MERGVLSIAAGLALLRRLRQPDPPQVGIDRLGPRRPPGRTPPGPAASSGSGRRPGRAARAPRPRPASAGACPAQRAARCSSTLRKCQAPVRAPAGGARAPRTGCPRTRPCAWPTSNTRRVCGSVTVWLNARAAWPSAGAAADRHRPRRHRWPARAPAAA